MAGISPSAATAAPRSPLPELPVADGQGGCADNNDDDDDNDNFSPLLERFPHLFAQKVLQHLEPIDRTFLAQAGRACRAAVAAADLPRAGSREEVLGKSVWVVTHRLSEFVDSVERLAWAKASGCPWSKPRNMRKRRAIIAGRGRLHVPRWAREHDCPWDELNDCRISAWQGHLQVLRWARENGCPWMKLVCGRFSQNHPVILAWVRAQP
jgi:hypothetical protein